MRILQWVSYAVSLPCQIILLNALVRGGLKTHPRGGFRTYPFLFAYVLVLFLWSVANIAASGGGRLPRSWEPAYWVVDLIVEVLLYAMVLSLMWRALRSNPNRARVVRLMIAGVALVWLAALALSHAERVNDWMTDFRKYTAFAGALMNLALWAVLVQKRHPDRSVLLISGGYGLQSAGEAIAYALRWLARPSHSFALTFGANLTAMIADSLGLLIWWRAIVREQSKPPAP